MNREEKQQNLLNLTVEDLGRALLRFKGKPFSLDGYRPFREIYNLSSNENVRSTTTKCSRQVGRFAPYAVM